MRSRLSLMFVSTTVTALAFAGIVTTLDDPVPGHGLTVWSALFLGAFTTAMVHGLRSAE